MPVGGEQMLAGAYTVTYNGTGVGIFEGDGGVPTIVATYHSEPVANTDKYGKKLITAFHLGSDWEFMGTILEWKAGSKAALFPFGTLGIDGVIARDYYDLASALVMTAVTGTPAATAADPATLTASKAIVPPGFSTRIPFGPTLRKFPLRLALLPTGGSAGNFTLT